MEDGICLTFPSTAEFMLTFRRESLSIMMQKDFQVQKTNHSIEINKCEDIYVYGMCQ